MLKTQFTNTLETAISICSRYLDECLERAVRSANSQLFDKLQHLSDNEQSDYSFAVNLLESNLEWIVGKIGTQVITELKDLEQSHSDGSTEDSQSGLNSLSLVSKDEFEDWLLVDVSKKKLERELGTALADVCVAFTKIYGEHSIVTENNLAIGPEKLLTHLKHAIDDLKIPAVAQITIYRAVTNSLSDDLLRMYAELLAAAKRDGIETKAAIKRPSPTSSPTISASNAPSSPIREAIKESLANTPVERGASMLPGSSSESEQRYASLNTLSRLGAALKNGHKLGGGAAYSASGEQKSAGNAQSEASLGASGLSQNPAFEVSPLLASLRGCKNAELSNNANGIESLKSWIQRERDQGHLGDDTLTEIDSELINVTDSLFDAFALETQGNGTLDRWLGKLKVVIFRSILADNSFFTNAEQPARQMLNRLGDLAEIVESGHSRLESILDRSIDKVVVEYDDDLSSIEDVVQELTSIFDRHVAAYKRNSERLARSYEGKQRVASVRYQVVKDIRALIGGDTFPRLLLQLLDNAGWREYMALCAVRDGVEGESYREALALVQQLAFWLRGIDSWPVEKLTEVSVEIGMEAPSLIDTLVRELSSLGKVGFEPLLKDLHESLLEVKEIELISVSDYDWPFAESERDLQNLLPKHEGASNKTRWHKQLVAMNTGDWLQLTLPDGGKRVLRLAWSGSESLRFVFVDSQGMKDEDLSIDELAGLMSEGKARLIEQQDVPLVDQGLHRMVQSVYEDLSGQSNCDPLTGLLTRQALERALDQSTAMAMSAQQRASLVYIDIDNFNVTNSTFGLSAGDETLRVLANALRDLSDHNSFCGRLGGNEFGLVLHACDVDQARLVAESIQTELKQNPPKYKGSVIATDISVGIARIDHEIDDYDSVLRKAEYACRQAKQNNSEKIVVYELQSNDEQRRSELLSWVSKLDGPLDSLLSLRVQEIRPVEKEPGRSSHWEILLGIKHEGQVIPPAPLIEAAENFGKITQVDRWVVGAALQWMKGNTDFVNASGGFSINLSGPSLSDNGFLDYVEKQIDESGVEPAKVCFEITETSAIVNLDFATEFIRVLKRKGCRFSLDDFGSGLSSYAYIQKLPVDFIKIDGMFVRNLVRNENDQALVRSINELAHFMGMETVAEFVENHDILEVLQDIGVDHSQGYGIRKPILLSELPKTSTV